MIVESYQILGATCRSASPERVGDRIVNQVTKAGTVTFLQSDVARLAQRIRVGAADPGGTAGPGGGPAELGDLIA